MPSRPRRRSARRAGAVRSRPPATGRRPALRQARQSVPLRVSLLLLGVRPGRRAARITSVASRLHGESDDPLAELGERDPAGRGGLWNETQLGHSRQGVRLEAVESAVLAAETEIDAGVPTQLERVERTP